MKVPFLIIGSGLSGLAAAIRYARYSPDVLILEKHSRIGGLNSYFYRNKVLFETGLHAITNFAGPKEKKAPLNLLFRQLKLDRKTFGCHEQIQSEICFIGRESLCFSNKFDFFRDQIGLKFPQSAEKFDNLVAAITAYPLFKSDEFQSARTFLRRFISDPLLEDMLLCPLMYYGSSLENDMDLSQFVIMFRSIFLEGLFRPDGTMKDFLDNLLAHYKNFGGRIQMQAAVTKILHKANKVFAVELETGEVIQCDSLLSTIGYEETLALLGKKDIKSSGNRLGFVESIFQLPISNADNLPKDKTIIFFNSSEKFLYERPREKIDLTSGVICFPSNFNKMKPQEVFEIRSTHLADYTTFKSCEHNGEEYLALKSEISGKSAETIEKIIGKFSKNIVYQDTFTPLTIERFTAKKEGAIYGRPSKIKDGKTEYDNLFLAGTDQGLLGIIGAMLSGVSMVNRHILPSIK